MRTEFEIETEINKLYENLTELQLNKMLRFNDYAHYSLQMRIVRTRIKQLKWVLNG